MEDFLLLLQVDPQIPYGRLLFTTALLLVSLGVLLFVLRSVRIKGLTTPKTGIGIITLLLSTPVLYANVTVPDPVDFNPSFSTTDLIGTWKSNDSQMQLRKDGTAILKLGPDHLSQTEITNGKAKWKKTGDFNVIIWKTLPRDSKAAWRAVRHRRELRIIVDNNEFPDLWDGDLGFRKQ